jgi:hypothetical protein
VAESRGISSLLPRGARGGKRIERRAGEEALADGSRLGLWEKATNLILMRLTRNDRMPRLSFFQLTKIFAAGFLGYAAILAILSVGTAPAVPVLRQEPIGHVDSHNIPFEDGSETSKSIDAQVH